MTTKNVEKLRDLYSWAEKQQLLREQGLPNEWEQQQWFIDVRRVLDLDSDDLDDTEMQDRARLLNMDCGTACCLAGKTAQDAGWRPAFNPASTMYATADVTRDGQNNDVATVARDILGLTKDEGVRLFRSDNELGDIRSILTEWGVLYDTIQAGA